jgi:hypothetical protein
MTKKLQDVLFGFTAASADEKLQKIRDIRKNRDIERPAVAQRQAKKTRAKKAKKKDTAKNALKGLTKEDLLALLAQVQKDE